MPAQRIVLRTVADLIRYRHRLRVFCDKCGCREVDLWELGDRIGLYAVVVGRAMKFRCSKCGGRGRPQITPIDTGPPA